MRNATSPLAPFDYDGWVKGLVFDLTPWDGVPIKIKQRKLPKAVRTIKPAIAVLTAEFDNVGRTVEKHRERVDHYGELYDGQRDMDGNIITDPNEMNGVWKPRKDEAWTAGRKATHTDQEGLDLLCKAFKALHDASEKD